jgi:hypothetical protein
MVEPIADAATYNAIAAGLVGQHPYGAYYDLDWAVGGLMGRGILYPVFLAPFYAVAGEPAPAAAGWLNALLLLPLTTLLVSVAGRVAFSRRVGVAAGWAFALWFPAAWHTRYLLTETLTDLLVAATLALLALTIARTSRCAGFVLGVVLGALSISHAAFQFLPLVMVLALGIHFRVVSRRSLPIAGLVAAGVLCVHAPYVAIRTAADLPRLGAGAQGYGGGGGWTFYVASRAETGFAPIPDDYVIGDLSAPGQLQEVARRIARGELNVEPDLAEVIRRLAATPDAAHATLTDADYLHAGVHNLLEHPGRLPEKLRLNASTLFVLPSGLPSYDQQGGAVAAEEPAPRRLLSIWRPLSGALLALTLLGLAYLLLIRPGRIVLAVPFAFQTALVLVSLAEPRYVVPLWSSMFLVAACGVAGWWERLRSGEWNRRRLGAPRSGTPSDASDEARGVQTVGAQDLVVEPAFGNAVDAH